MTLKLSADASTRASDDHGLLPDLTAIVASSAQMRAVAVAMRARMGRSAAMQFSATCSKVETVGLAFTFPGPLHFDGGDPTAKLLAKLRCPFARFD